jgi:hypothetical protein
MSIQKGSTDLDAQAVSDGFRDQQANTATEVKYIVGNLNVAFLKPDRDR